MLQNQHILVYRLSAMGDVAMTVPVIKAFVEHHPNIKITVASRGFLKPLFDNINNVTFFTVDDKNSHKGFFGLYKLYKELKGIGITHVADLHNVLRSKIIGSFFKLSGIPVIKIDKGRAEKKALTRVNNKVFKQLKTSHQRYADVFEKLGFPVTISNPTFNKPQLLTEKILKITKEKTTKWIGIAPFAAFESKTYPLDLLEQVIQQLSNKEYQLFLFGGKADYEVLESFSNKFNSTINVAGKLEGIKNELSLISNLDVMLSMDSGNAHFSAMLGIKTITIWGGTHPFAGFAPFNQPEDYCLLPDLEKYPNLPCSIYGNKVSDGYEDVMRSISPEKITNKIISII
ncbi:MAG: glycosyltransferase family 9 protein [Flavobacteriaceae bacterium]